MRDLIFNQFCTVPACAWSVRSSSVTDNGMGVDVLQDCPDHGAPFVSLPHNPARYAFKKGTTVNHSDRPEYRGDEFLSNAELAEMDAPSVPDEDWNWYLESAYVDPAEIDDSCCRNPACGCGGRFLPAEIDRWN
jgi:hypothetical protein